MTYPLRLQLTLGCSGLTPCARASHAETTSPVGHAPHARGRRVRVFEALKNRQHRGDQRMADNVAFRQTHHGDVRHIFQARGDIGQA